MATSTSTSWTYDSFLTTVLLDEATIIAWLQQKNLLNTSMTCSKCSSQCRFVSKKGTFFWRCPMKGYQAVKSVRPSTTARTLSIQWLRPTHYPSSATGTAPRDSMRDIRGPVWEIPAECMRRRSLGHQVRNCVNA